MPAVLTAPPQTEIPSIAFFGRSLNEYVQAFSLDLHALRGRAVLDVAGGPSSFTAEACRRGVDAVAIDPRYGSAPDELRSLIEADHTRIFTQLRTKPRLLKGSGRSRPATPPRFPPPMSAKVGGTPCFSSLTEAEEDRRAAAQRFLADYEARLYHGRYIEGGLPQLPFFDGAFDLVLCGYLLFTYATRFDFDWHLAACRELARVSAGEVRIHAICSLEGRPYPEMGRLRRELLLAGVTSEIVRVPDESLAGAGSMLVLNPGA
jgi:hypothetical protein